MLPRKYRLSKKEFTNLKENGRLVSGRLMGVLVSNSSTGTKAGIIVSKKISPKAFARNYLKRKIRVALRQVLPNLKNNRYLIVLPNRRAIAASVQEFEKDIKDILEINN